MEIKAMMEIQKFRNHCKTMMLQKKIKHYMAFRKYNEMYPLLSELVNLNKKYKR